MYSSYLDIRKVVLATSYLDILKVLSFNWSKRSANALQKNPEDFDLFTKEKEMEIQHVVG
jgi:hypothetical protein